MRDFGGMMGVVAEEYLSLIHICILVPSPKVATYDLQPEMSAYEVKDKLVEAINTKKFDFIVVNYEMCIRARLRPVRWQRGRRKR